MGGRQFQRTAWTGRSHPDRDLHLLYALTGAAIAAYIPFIALVLRSRGFDPARIGVILAAAASAGVAANTVWSHLADTRLGSARTLRIASIAAAAAASSLAFTGGRFWVTLIVAAVLGGVTGPGSGLADSLALAHLGEDRAAEYGTIRLWASLGWAVAVVAFGVLYEWGTISWMLPTYACGMLVCAAVTLRFPSTRPIEPPEPSRLGSVGRLFRDRPRFAALLGALFVVAVATSAAWSFLPLRIASRGGGPILVGLAAGLAAFVEIPIMRASPKVLRRVSLRAMCVTGIGVYVALMLAWSLLMNPTMVALATAVRGVWFGLSYVSLVLIAGRLAPPSLRNTGQVLVQTTTLGLAPVAGNALGGVVYQRLGASALFTGAASLATIGAAGIWLILSTPETSRPLAAGATNAAGRPG